MPTEMGAILPSHLSSVDQAEKRFVYERGRLEGMATPLARHLPADQTAQFRLHERQQPLEGLLIAVAPRPQQLGYCRG